MDHFNLTNIHRYVDGVQHIVVLAKIDNGQLIAAYSEGAFKPHSISSKRGLLFNLTQQRVF